MGSWSDDYNFVSTTSDFRRFHMKLLKTAVFAVIFHKPPVEYSALKYQTKYFVASGVK